MKKEYKHDLIGCEFMADGCGFVVGAAFHRIWFGAHGRDDGDAARILIEKTMKRPSEMFQTAFYDAELS